MQPSHVYTSKGSDSLKLRFVWEKLTSEAPFVLININKEGAHSKHFEKKMLVKLVKYVIKDRTNLAVKFQ